MRQATIQLKTRIQNVNIMNNNVEIRQIILKTMFSMLAFLAFSYILILGNMVFDIAERKTLEKELLTLTNEVRNLELSYLSVSNNIDLDLSSSMGFKEAKATFAIRKSLGSLKLAKNEI